MRLTTSERVTWQHRWLSCNLARYSANQVQDVSKDSCPPKKGNQGALVSALNDLSDFLARRLLWSVRIRLASESAHAVNSRWNHPVWMKPLRLAGLIELQLQSIWWRSRVASHEPIAEELTPLLKFLPSDGLVDYCGAQFGRDYARTQFVSAVLQEELNSEMVFHLSENYGSEILPCLSERYESREAAHAG